MTSVLVLGGARSGKSAYAERLLSGCDDVRYVAPAPRVDDDPEWAARIDAHRSRRPADWQTLETADLVGAIGAAPAGSALLVDCLGTWLTRLVDDAGCWDDRDAVAALWSRAGDRLAEALPAASADVVLVSNETGLGVVPASASGRLFRDGLGRLNRVVADACDQVALVVAGRVLDLSTAPRLTDTARLGGPR